MTTALELYALGLQDGVEGTASALRIDVRDGGCLELPLERWLGPLEVADEDVLGRARGPVLDIGCGPGRHVHGLARRGVLALGVDVSPVAVKLARQRGADALEASVFDHLPGAGSWRTALLLDGNIGIGGCPVRLLERVRALLVGDGEILVELDQREAGIVRLQARLEGSYGRSDWFAWARVGTVGIVAVAKTAGLCVDETWAYAERRFARLTFR